MMSWVRVRLRRNLSAQVFALVGTCGDVYAGCLGWAAIYVSNVFVCRSDRRCAYMTAGPEGDPGCLWKPAIACCCYAWMVCRDVLMACL